MVVEHLPAETFEHPLLHLVGRLHVQSDPGDCAEGTQSDHQAVEVGVTSGCLDDLTAGRHDRKPGDRGREVATGDARAVRRRRHGTGDGDVGKRGEGVQGHALVVQRLDQIAVLHTATAGDRLCFMVDDHVSGQVLERDQLPGVGDVVERVPRAQHMHAGCVGDDLLHLFHRRRSVQLLRPVRVVAGPVPFRRMRLSHGLPPSSWLASKPDDDENGDV